MKIAYIAAGAAGMYCGSCLHDNTLARAMLEMGEDVILVPTYTPIRTDEKDVSHERVFFGGINAYLQQHVPLFRYTPRWLDRLFDQPWLLNLVSKRSASVDPAKLGGMTVSMLRGEGGNQAKEVEKLVDWLVDEVRPDVVHLSNSMLLGMARRIHQRCGPPVVCSLSGEDIFLEKLTEPHYSEARQLLRERAAEVAAFTALNGYYADMMAEYLSVDRAKVHVVPHGLDLAGYENPPPLSGEAIGLETRGEGVRVSVQDHSLVMNDSPSPSPSLRGRGSAAPPIVGYLCRVCHDKGLHVLVDACERLAGEHDFVLHAAGYLGAADRPYLAEIEQRVARGPLAGRFAYRGELTREQKIAFLRSLAVFSTPTVYRESKGLPAIEALAAGTPVVLPDHGSFPELVQEAGAGHLHLPEDAGHLAEHLAELLTDREKAENLGETGRRHVHEHRTAARMADHTLDLYRTLI